MLKKPSITILTYGNIHSLYYTQSIPASTIPTTPNQSHTLRQPSKRRLQRRYHATAHSGTPDHGPTEDLPWPEPSSTTVVPTPYEILCIKRGDPYSKRRFYELAKLYHPDRNGQQKYHAAIGSLPGAVKMERYRMIVAAHEILSDPIKRSAYDASGAGWDGRPAHGEPKYRWDRPHDNRWSGFDTNDPPFRNATWEDWERWYQRDKVKQEPVYFSNGGFIMLVVATVFLGGFGQSWRVGDYANVFKRQVEMAHEDASKTLQKRKNESTGSGNRDERLQSFLKSRDPHGYGITDPTEEGYRKALPEADICMSDDLRQRSRNRGLGPNQDQPS